MIALEDIMSAAMTAPPDRREAALRILRGELPKEEPYLTLRELSRRLGFGITTLRRWRIPGHGVSGAKRYRFAEVEAYFATEAFQRRKAAIRAERAALAKEVSPSRSLSRTAAIAGLAFARDQIPTGIASPRTKKGRPTWQS